MMEQYQRLGRWNRWANRLVLEALRGAGGEPPKALGAFQHVVETELTWLRRIAGTPDPNAPLWGPASLEQCERWSAEAESLLETLLGRLDEGRLAATFSYQRLQGDAFTDTVADGLLHMFLHSMQYRGEAAAYLNAAGHRVPDFDFIFWLRKGQPA